MNESTMTLQTLPAAGQEAFGAQGLATRPAMAPALPAHDPMSQAMSVAAFYSMDYMAGIAQLAQTAVRSKMYGELTESQAVMILQTGLEMGISPTVALRNIGSFKGKTTIASALALARVKAAGYLVDISEKTAEAVTVTIQKPGHKPHTERFTMQDAIKQGLPGRNPLYGSIPATMLLNRAIGLCCRYGAAEVAAGLYAPEEAMDIIDEPVVPVVSSAASLGVAEPAAKPKSTPAGGIGKGAKVASAPKPPTPAAQAQPLPPMGDTHRESLRRHGRDMGIPEDAIARAEAAMDQADMEARRAFFVNLTAGDKGVWDSYLATTENGLFPGADV